MSNFVWRFIFANEEYDEVEKKIEKLTKLLVATEQYQNLFNEKKLYEHKTLQKRYYL